MIPASLVPTLANDADLAIDQVLRNGVPPLGLGPPKSEPAFVAAFVLGAVADIAARWRAHLRPLGMRIRATGVFVHGAPRVSFTDSSGGRKSCELSDLLVVLDDERAGKLIDRQAVLVQAKMAPGGTTTLTRPGDLTQHDLMSGWPPFTFNARSYRPHARDFSTCRHSGATIDCGRYGLIDNKPTTPQWYQHVPSAKFAVSTYTFGKFMGDMTGPRYPTSGRPALGRADDWSDTVEELLQVTRSKTFSLRRALPGRHDRQKDALAMIEVSEQHLPIFTYGSGPPPPWEDQGEPEDEGISTAHVVIERETRD